MLIYANKVIRVNFNCIQPSIAIWKSLYNWLIKLKLKEAGLPIECTKGEAGFGQHEINISHDECLKMSDNAYALKLVIIIITIHIYYK